MNRKAECCCGACVVHVKGEPLLNGICNCNNCKKRTGSAFGHSAYFAETNFELLKGKLQSYDLSNDAGKQQRHFCLKCGTTLFWTSETFKNCIGIAGGCFIESPLTKPECIAQPETQCGWLSFDNGIRIGLTVDDIPIVD